VEVGDTDPVVTRPENVDMVMPILETPPHEVGQGTAASWLDHLPQARPCNGRDRHVFGMSGRAHLVFAVVAVAVLAFVVALNQFANLGVYAIGLLVGAVLVSGYSITVDGPDLVQRRFGLAKRVPLGSITRVALYRHRGSTSLRLWMPDGTRAPSILISGRYFRLDPAAAGHLCKWLDRSDVSWGPGAWQLVASQAATPTSGSADAGGTSDPALRDHSAPRPRGRIVAARPPSRWARALRWFSMASLAIAGITLLILTPVTWSNYFESQRIQHGPEVVATLRSEWITSTSDRTGTHYTTHFAVTFDTTDHHFVTTTISAHGSYELEHLGYRMTIRYDPGAPQDAELPGAPNNTITSALVVTAVAVFFCLIFVGLMRGLIRVRRARLVSRMSTASTERITPGANP
jgi:hypothetical protein